MRRIDRLDAGEILVDKRIHQLVAERIEKLRRGCRAVRHYRKVPGIVERIHEIVYRDYSVRCVRRADTEDGIRGRRKVNVKAANENLILKRSTGRGAVDTH